MNGSRSMLLYDWFKLTVVLILLILLIVFLLTPPKNANIPAIAAQAATHTLAPSLPATATASLVPAAPTSTSSPVPQATNTLLPTATQAPTLVPTAVPETPTSTPATALATETATPLPIQPIAAGDCSVAISSHLAVGMDVQVARNLNLRSSADMQNNLIRTHPTGTRLTVTNGPVCTPYGSKAYLWWEVRAADGVIGWSAEGSLEGNFYFLVPVK